MYNAERLEELRQRAGAIGKPIHEALIKDIARRIRKTGAITSTAEYQIYRAEALGMAEKGIKAAVAKEIKASESAIDLLFQDMADETVMFEKNAQLHQLIDAYSAVAKKATAEDFKNLWMPAPDGKLYTVKQAYAKIMDFAFFQTASGTYGINSAVRKATKELLARGVRTIPREGKGSMRIEYATRSFITNRMGELHNEISKMNYAAIGANGWEITAHRAPAEDHAYLQGRQFTAAEFELINDNLKRKIGWWHCMHLVFPIIIGKSPPAHSKEQLQKYLDENEKGLNFDGRQLTLYQANNYRNTLENLISNTKNQLLAAEGDKAWTAEIEHRLGNMRREYARFCKATGLKVRPDRIYVEGFGRSEASKAAWTYRRNTQKAYQDRSFSIKTVTDKSISSVPKIHGNSFTDAQADNLQKAHRLLLEKVRHLKLGTEVGVYLDENMSPVSDVVIGTLGRINMPPSTSTTCALAHTHPSGELFSLDDLTHFTTDENLAILTAIGNDGSLFMLEKTADYNFTEIQKLFIQAALEKPTSIEGLPDIIKKREVLFDAFRRYGLNYTAIRIN